MTSAPTVRAATDEDFPGIVALLQQFEHRESERHYRWKFLDAPLGAVSVVAEQEGRIVGHYGYVAREFLVAGRLTRVGLGTDILVDRGLRGRGAGIAIFRHSPAVARDRGLEYVYGFPNVRSAGAGSRAGIHNVLTIPLFVKPLAIERVWRRVTTLPWPGLARPLLELPFRERRSRSDGRLPADKQLGLEVVARFPADVDQLWTELLADPTRQLQTVARRSAASLNWRFADCPDRRYEIVCARDGHGRLAGYAILREMELFELRCGAIVDIWPALGPPAGVTSLVRFALDRFREHQLDIAVCLFGGAGPLRRALGESGFRPIVRRFNPRPFELHMRETSLRPLPAALRDLDHAHWTFADGDVI